MSNILYMHSSIDSCEFSLFNWSVKFPHDKGTTFLKYSFFYKILCYNNSILISRIAEVNVPMGARKSLVLCYSMFSLCIPSLQNICVYHHWRIFFSDEIKALLFLIYFGTLKALEHAFGSLKPKHAFSSLKPNLCRHSLNYNMKFNGRVCNLELVRCVWVHVVLMGIYSIVSFWNFRTKDF